MAASRLPPSPAPLPSGQSVTRGCAPLPIALWLVATLVAIKMLLLLLLLLLLLKLL
jgi:hypothetical protein